jgi:hypothetical protein
VIELRGATEDVKDHLDRFHREVDLHDAEVLRLCAWKLVADSAPTGTRRSRVSRCRVGYEPADELSRRDHSCTAVPLPR